jgi:hypothetical protein
VDAITADTIVNRMARRLEGNIGTVLVCWREKRSRSREMGEVDPWDFLFLAPMKQRVSVSSFFMNRIGTLWRAI